MGKHKSMDFLAPSSILSNMMRKFPSIFKTVETIQKDSNYSIVPSGVITNVLEHAYGIPTVQASKIAGCIHALYEWRNNKQIYDFNPDIATELVKSFDSAASLPIEAFEEMPYDGLYMSVSGTPFSAFATKDMSFDKNNNRIKSISFYIPANDKTISIPLMRDTIAKCMNADYHANIAQLNDPNCIRALKMSYPHMSEADIKKSIMDSYAKGYQADKDLLEMCISLLLYLCSQNAEITDLNGNPTSAKGPDKQEKSDESNNLDTKKPPAPTKSKKSKSRTVKVGYRIGKAIRYSKNQQQESDSVTASVGSTSNDSHTKKAAHVRRGHYHHYWTGSHKDGTRKLILKWTAPAFINASGTDDIIPTMHKIK